MPPVEVHYETAGERGAPAVVLSNSIGTTMELWRPQLDALAARFHVIRYDQRGHGKSPVPPGPYTVADLGGDLLALLDRLGVARVHVVGLSIGGMVGMWLAAHAPARVDRLALLCTSAYLPPAQGWLDRAATVRAEGTAAVVDASLGRWFTRDMRDRDPATVAGFREMMCGVPDEGYAASCEAIAAMDLRAELPRIAAPTLVIAGADDPATPPDHAELIAAGVAGARLEIVAGAAHLANVERPEVVTDLLLDHLTAEGAQGTAP